MRHKPIPLFLAALALAPVFTSLPASAQTAEAAPLSAMPGGNTYNLADFGPIGTNAQADKTLATALRAIQSKGGGILLIPLQAPTAWQPVNTTQSVIRTPPPPAPATYWTYSPAVTVFDTRQSSILLPDLTGLSVERNFLLPLNDSSPHWQYHPLIHLGNVFLKGTSDYSGQLVENSIVGKAQRFYVSSISGVFPGQYLTVSDGKNSEQLRVAQLGYDRQKREPYFVADALRAWSSGADVMRQDRLSVIKSVTKANNELQTFDIDNIRYHYSQGDSYLNNAILSYQGNPRSPMTKRFPQGVSDQSGFGSVLYNATVAAETNIFRGEVAAVNFGNEIVFKNAVNAQTLSTGRPVINMNPKKWITEGSASISNPGGKSLNWGRSLFSRDAPWTKDVIGRFFALDIPSEYVPGTDVRRWYLITNFNEEADGTKVLGVQRFWWGAKNSGVGISELYDGRNYTSNMAKPVLLKYIIAPGSYAYDVADGVGADETQSAGAGRHAFKVAPYPDSGATFNFAPGDRIEQAIGNDPMPPIPFRAWSWDIVPGVFPSPIFDVGNNGSAPRNVLNVSGTSTFGTVLKVDAGVHNAINVMAQIKRSLFLFRQKDNNEQNIRWENPNRTLGVNPKTGVLQFNGPLDLNNRGLGVKGLGTSPTNNLRGLAMEVPAGARSVQVNFATPESDERYAATVQPSWATNHAVTQKNAAGFTIEFDVPAPAQAKLDWLLVR